MPKKKTARGHLLPILLATIACFTAITVAIFIPRFEEWGRLPEKDAMMRAQEVMQMAAETKTQLQKMTASGHDLDDVVFTNDDGTPCSMGKNCLFATEGGGATAPYRPKDVVGEGGHLYHWEAKTTVAKTGWSFEGRPFAADGVKDVGTEDIDLVMTLESIPYEVCTKINQDLGIEGIPLEKKTKDEGEYLLEILPGKTQGCVEWNRWPVTLYVYFHVLAAH